MTTNTALQEEKLAQMERVLGKHLDPLTDFGFKKLFGQDDSKEFLISFLNSLLQNYGAPTIEDLTYRNTEVFGTIELDRKVVYDIYCTTTEGTNFVVELQKGYQSYYKNRSLCYGCRAISDQMIKGAEYKFALNKVFVISILNFSISEYQHKPKDQYLHSVSLRDDVNPHEVAFDNLQFVFIELPKFNKKVTKDTPNMDKWILLLKSLAHFNDLAEDNSAYIDQFWTRFFQRAKIRNLATVELDDYEDSVKYLNEISDVKEAYADLLQQKVEEAVEEANKQKEAAVQREMEAQQKIINSIKKRLTRGDAISDIAEDMDLSESEILKLKD
jgi:predicted transposase/invertase (TIGR01784 family)